jgi:hypothetical protein
MDFTTTTDLELAEFVLDPRFSADDRALLVAEFVNRHKKKAYREGYSDGVADAKNGIA